MGKGHIQDPLAWIKKKIAELDSKINGVNSDLQNTNVKYKDITLAQCTITGGKSAPVLPASGGTTLIGNINVIGVKILTVEGSYDDGYLGAYLANNGYVHIVNGGSESRTYTKIVVRVFYV